MSEMPNTPLQFQNSSNIPLQFRKRQIPSCNCKTSIKYPLQMALPLPFMSSPVSTTPMESPSPSMSLMAQSLSKSLGSSSINAMVASLRNLQLKKLKFIPYMPVNRNI
ncbi:hypothetical protein QL285_030572 [Trifolium repens]|nr:hypothetical protein QL285_030572 [Trifolium repens]